MQLNKTTKSQKAKTHNDSKHTNKSRKQKTRTTNHMKPATNKSQETENIQPTQSEKRKSRETREYQIFEEKKQKSFQKDIFCLAHFVNASTTRKHDGTTFQRLKQLHNITEQLFKKQLKI